MSQLTLHKPETPSGTSTIIETIMPPIIHFDYDFSPYGTKTKILLQAAGIPYQKCDQPLVLPRPDLEELGITYRRIPLLAIGKDIYADSALITTTIITQLGGKIQHSPADRAYQQWGDEVFSEALSLISVDLLTPEFVKDREAIFPSLKRSDFKSLRPSGVAQFIARLNQVEHEFLSSSSYSSGPFIHGSEISVADVHIAWPLLWALTKLGLEKEGPVGREAFPKTWKLIDALPKPEPEVLSAKETQERIRGSEYTAKGPSGVANGDPLGLKEGTSVTVESFDAEPGKYPQAGKLIASNDEEVVLEIKDGLRLHFPRIGYIVRPQ